MATATYNSDQIGPGMRVIPPGKKQLVEVIDVFTNGGQRDVYCWGRSGRVAFTISRYDSIEIEARADTEAWRLRTGRTVAA